MIYKDNYYIYLVEGLSDKSEKKIFYYNNEFDFSRFNVIIIFECFIVE